MALFLATQSLRSHSVAGHGAVGIDKQKGIDFSIGKGFNDFLFVLGLPDALAGIVPLLYLAGFFQPLAKAPDGAERGSGADRLPAGVLAVQVVNSDMLGKYLGSLSNIALFEKS